MKVSVLKMHDQECQRAGFNMSKEGYDKAMHLLDIIEYELNKVASAVGHCSYAEYFSSDMTGP